MFGNEPQPVFHMAVFSARSIFQQHLGMGYFKKVLRDSFNVRVVVALYDVDLI
jgi:hypothetical protein